MLDILYTLSLVKYQCLQIFHHKNFGSELSIGFCIELYSEIEANFNFQWTQKCLFVRGPYRWHMLNFFLSAEVAILDRQKNPKTFSTHQIASIIDTNGHAIKVKFIIKLKYDKANRWR